MSVIVIGADAEVEENSSKFSTGHENTFYFVHVKSHHDDANDTLTDVNVLGNIRADAFVQW